MMRASMLARYRFLTQAGVFGLAFGSQLGWGLARKAPNVAAAEAQAKVSHEMQVQSVHPQPKVTHVLKSTLEDPRGAFHEVLLA